MPNDDLGSANQWDIVPCEPTESGMSRDLRAYQVGSQVVINDISNVSICARDFGNGFHVLEQGNIVL